MDSPVTCAGIWPPPSRQERFFWYLDKISHVATCGCCLMSYYGALPRRVWLHLFCTLPVGNLKQLDSSLSSSSGWTNPVLSASPCMSCAPATWCSKSLIPGCQNPSCTGESKTGHSPPGTVSQAPSRRQESLPSTCSLHSCLYSSGCGWPSGCSADSCCSCCQMGLPGIFLQNCFVASWWPTCPAAWAKSISSSGICICLCWTSKSFCQTTSAVWWESSKWQPCPPAY